jgi:hypothetical protein
MRSEKSVNFLDFERAAMTEKYRPFLQLMRATKAGQPLYMSTTKTHLQHLDPPPHRG